MNGHSCSCCFVACGMSVASEFCKARSHLTTQCWAFAFSHGFAAPFKCGAENAKQKYDLTSAQCMRQTHGGRTSLCKHTWHMQHKKIVEANCHVSMCFPDHITNTTTGESWSGTFIKTWPYRSLAQWPKLSRHCVEAAYRVVIPHKILRAPESVQRQQTPVADSDLSFIHMLFFCHV